MFLIQTSTCFDLWSKSELNLDVFEHYATSSFPNVRFSFLFSRPQSESIEFQLPERKPQCLHFPPAQHRLLQPGGHPRGQWSSQEVKLSWNVVVFVLGLINLRLHTKQSWINLTLRVVLYKNVLISKAVQF